MEPKPIRVLLVNDHLGFAGGVIHGVTRYFLAVLPRLDPAKVQLTACFFRDWHPAAEQLEAQGVHPIFLNRRKWDPRVLTDLIRLIRDHDIEILHLNGLKGCLLGRIAARITGCAAIIHWHDINPLGFLVGFLQRRVARWTDTAITLSKSVADLVVRDLAIPKERVEVLYGGLDLSPFTQSLPEARSRIRAELDISESARVVGIVGRLSPEKNHRLLIQAMPGLLAHCPDAILVVVGDGPTKQECEALVRSMNLEAAVRFTGNRSDVPDILAGLDVVAQPSLREGLGYAAVEALAAGKPVVGSRVGGIPEIVIHGETGLLVSPHDKDELTDALLHLLTDKEYAAKLAKGGRRHAETFGLDRHLRRLEEIYSEVVRSARNEEIAASRRLEVSCTKA